MQRANRRVILKGASKLELNVINAAEMRSNPKQLESTVLRDQRKRLLKSAQSDSARSRAASRINSLSNPSSPGIASSATQARLKTYRPKPSGPNKRASKRLLNNANPKASDRNKD